MFQYSDVLLQGDKGMNLASKDNVNHNTAIHSRFQFQSSERIIFTTQVCCIEYGFIPYEIISV